MKQEGIVRLTVEKHFTYNAQAPEEFDWSLVINPRVQEIGRALAESIFIRRAQAELFSPCSDPSIAGLQEALRVIARTAIWATMTEAKAKAAHAAHWRFPNVPSPRGNRLESTGIGKDLAWIEESVIE